MRIILIFLCISGFNYAHCQDARTAVAELTSDNINGIVYFNETGNGIHVTGSIVGLPTGLYGFHVHEIGDISNCDASGAHFNPSGNDHGGREHAVRHVGDLGNVQFIGVGSLGVATINFVDNVIALDGENSILGRTLVLHGQEDDLGQGGHETSLTTGNAGARVACGIIRDANPGNSVGAFIPSIVMLFLSTAFIYITL